MNEDNVQRQFDTQLTYSPWYEHVKGLISTCWQIFLIYSFAAFSIFYFLVEVIEFFLGSAISLKNIPLLLLGILGTLGVGIFRCVIVYNNQIPKGLENESREIQRVAHRKKLFWEFHLAFLLMQNRISQIDQDLDDLINNRILIPTSSAPDIVEYSKWLSTRLDSLIKMASSAKQLLVFDLGKAIQTKKNNEMDIPALVRVIGLIKNLYKAAYEFEAENRRVKVPEGFERAHELQSGWSKVIQDGFRQMMAVLEEVVRRDKDDRSPIHGNIIFDAPPEIEEFVKEISRLGAQFPSNPS